MRHPHAHAQGQGFAARRRLILGTVGLLSLVFVLLMLVSDGPSAATVTPSPVHLAPIRLEEGHRELAIGDMADLFKSKNSGEMSNGAQKSEDAFSLEKAYCRMTNRMNSKSTTENVAESDDIPTNQSCMMYHLGSLRNSHEDDFALVVTAHEANFWKEDGTCDLSCLAWMAEVSLPTIIIVKSNRTVSFRGSNNRWTKRNNVSARQGEQMFRELNPSASTGATTSAAESVFRSVLRSEWHRAEQLQHGDDDEGRADARTRVDSQGTACQGVEWIRTKMANNNAQDVYIFESPNVGDEALSIVEVSLRLVHAVTTRKQNDEDHSHADSNNVKRSGDEPDGLSKYSALDSLLTRARNLIFVHHHRSSWHGLDIVEQLKCVCMDRSVERYRTLTSPSKSYLLQCMPLHMDEEESLSLVLQRDVSDVARKNKDVIAMRRRQVERAAAVTRMFGLAFEYLFEVKVLPDAVVRDCCASFIVTREAVLSAAATMYGERPKSMTSLLLFQSLRQKLLEQPLHVTKYHNDTDQKRFNIVPGDLSMYLERFWRTLFGASKFDTHRDIAVGQCDKVPSSIAFECPPQWRVQSVQDLHPDVQRAIADGRITCDAEFSANNKFRDPVVGARMSR